MPAFIDLTGEKFGRLTVVSQGTTVTYKAHRGRRTVWNCVCECGERSTVSTSDLRSGRIQSCGCLHREIVTLHGATANSKRPPEYQTWVAMKVRCLNRKHPSYLNYGGRGIKVCERWIDSFAHFYADMGSRPDGTSIDRINNDGNYEPSNCRWATRREQSDNQGHHPRLLTYAGETKTRAAFAKQFGITEACLRTRMDRRGWSLEKALTTPTISPEEQGRALGRRLTSTKNGLEPKSSKQ